MKKLLSLFLCKIPSNLNATGSFQKNDPLAFKRHDAMYWDNICLVMNTLVRVNLLIKGISQDVFVKVWDRFNSDNPLKGQQFALILNTVRNATIEKVHSTAYYNKKLEL